VASGPEPLNTNLSLRRVHVPVLDVYAEDDMDAQFAAGRRQFMAGRMTQVPIAGARHDYRGHEDEVIRAVLDWLRKQEQR
jgi:pimeloyl-ACP methyl ester carboxylesterase